MTPLENLQSEAFERFAALQRRRWVDPSPAAASAAEAAFAEFECLLREDPAEAGEQVVNYALRSQGEAAAGA